MLPIVVPETLITAFKYWQSGIKVGMSYQNELYVQLKTYTTDERLAAYDDGYKVAKMNLRACITVNMKGYTLWQSLRSVLQEAADDLSETKLSQKSLESPSKYGLSIKS